MKKKLIALGLNLVWQCVATVLVKKFSARLLTRP